VWVAQGAAQPSGPHLEQALRLLARLLAAARRARWVHQEIQILIQQALALQAKGDQEGAVAALARALALAEPGGYVRTFVDEGASLRRLLYRAAERDLAPGYAGRLLASFDGAGSVDAASDEATPNLEPEPQLVEPLSEREIEVLRLIADGLTNREVGQQLVISLGTVKAHTSNIYGKLGVRSRTQAVARARELAIL
jgi:LuxR family maltose regulon positive regulatory protein